MPHRSLLRNQIGSAWRKAIATDYTSQRINSERSLQAAVWAHLNEILPAKTRRMFIEPRLHVGTGQGGARYPDIAICNTRQVIGLIELKYQPRVRPSWAKDLETFQWVANNFHHLTISNSRFRGSEKDATEYSLSDSLLYVWAGVHAPSKDDLHSQLDRRLAPKLLVLSAVTANGKNPEILVRARSGV